MDVFISSYIIITMFCLGMINYLYYIKNISDITIESESLLNNNNLKYGQIIDREEMKPEQE